MSNSDANAPGPDLRAEGFPLDELPDGAMRVGQVDGQEVMLARRGDTIFAAGARCTHYSGPLFEGLLVGDTVRCPWHHACFSLPTGEALRAPALNPLPTWDCEVRDGRVFVTQQREMKDPLAPQGLPSSRGSPPAAVVIIGAGAAGSAAAEMLRRQGYAGPITMVDPEPDAPYDRPNLSKDYLAGTAQEEWIPLRPPGFYEEHKVAIRRTRATRIDVAQSRVVLQNGESLSYAALLLAPGAEPRMLDIPGHDRPFVHVLRSLADCKSIIAGVAPGRQAVILGASFIGLESAASLRQRGMEVTVVGPEAVPFERVLGTEFGRRLQRLHEAHGVRVVLGTTPTRIEDGRVVLTNGMTLPADLVIIGVGVMPRVQLAEEAGLSVDRGILVNEFLETSAPGIYAAGDAARWLDRRTGARVRVEHWVLAQRHGQTAACNMLGAHEPFEEAPFFWTHQYDLELRYTGHAERWSETPMHGNPGTGDGSVGYALDERISAVASVGEDLLNLRAEVALDGNDQRGLRQLMQGP